MGCGCAILPQINKVGEGRNAVALVDLHERGPRATRIDGSMKRIVF